MKRVLLLGIILAIFILLMPQGVSAAEPVPVTINAQYGEATTFNADLSAAFKASGWDLSPSDSDDNINRVTDAIEFDVMTYNDWSVSAQDITEGSKAWGYLVGSGNNLQNPFEMTVSDGTTWDDLTAHAVIPVNSGGPLSTHQTWAEDIRQIVKTNDYGSDVGTGWTITIQFTCTTDF